MKSINKTIIDAIIKKAEALCPDSLALNGMIRLTTHIVKQKRNLPSHFLQNLCQKSGAVQEPPLCL